MECNFEGCEKPRAGLGLCQGHYFQTRRGVPLRPLRSYTTKYQGPTVAGHKYCPVCKEHVLYDQWAKSKACKDGLSSRCKQCQNKINAKQTQENRRKISEIKIRSGCTDCGYKDHPDALDFDHLPGYKKVGAVGNMSSRAVKWAVLQAEIDKCEVVCANCHRVRTANRRKETASE